MSKRFECSREFTGRVWTEKKFFGIITIIKHEYKVLTNLLSHDITDEWHYEWKIVDWEIN